MYYSLSQIFDIDELKGLCESFSNLTGLATALLDLEGNVLIATGWQPVCLYFHRANTLSRKNCLESDTILAGQLEDGQKFNVYKCKNGLVDVAIPIIIENNHIGNFFTGQFLSEEPDLQYFTLQAELFGFNKKNYFEALYKAAIYSDDFVKKTVEFYSNFTKIIGNLGVSRLRNLEYAKQLEDEKQKLHQQNSEYFALNEEYKAINEQLDIIEESEEKLRFIFDNTIQGVVYQNAKGEIIYANKSAERILGLTLDQMQGRTSIDPRWRAVHEDDSDYPGETHPAMVSLQTAKPVSNSIMGIYNPNNNTYNWININAIPKFKANENTPYQVIATFEDITDIKNATAELLKAKAKAEESDHLKSAFLENISHEIRTPMNQILGFSRLLNNQTISAETRNQYTNNLHKSINQLLTTVENIITLSHIETNQLLINRIEFNLNLLVTKLYKEYENKKYILSKSHIQFNLSVPENADIKLLDDYTRLSQILSILLDNAFKFTEVGQIDFGYVLLEKSIEFFVNDTGIGISTDKLSYILNSFAHADDSIQQSFGGLGVGLSIAKGLLQLMQSELKIESNFDKGTKVSFCLPIVGILK